ncbi:MAG TPA: lysophospholipid acyltransferase family protein [Steroidobacteraceae bacterium]|nr:lysophospholipid acyltransferase family protein [Steroidobacteraceae bacterium]
MSSPEASAGPRPLKTLHDYLVTYAMLIVLGLICLAFSLWALLVYPLLPRRWGTAAGRCGIMAGFRLYSWLLTLSGAYRLDLRAIDSLREGPPVILAPNHPSLIDALLILTRHPNVACVMKAELLGNIFLGAGSRLARYIPSDQPRQMIKEAVADLRRGGILLLFPEGTRTTREPVNPLKASVGVIAKHAQVPVQVAVIETDSPYLGKGWGLFRRPVLPITYRIRLGRRFDPPQDVNSFMAALEREYGQQLSGSLQSDWLGHEVGSQADSYSR